MAVYSRHHNARKARFCITIVLEFLYSIKLLTKPHIPPAHSSRPTCSNSSLILNVPPPKRHSNAPHPHSHHFSNASNKPNNNSTKHTLPPCPYHATHSLTAQTPTSSSLSSPHSPARSQHRQPAQYQSSSSPRSTSPYHRAAPWPESAAASVLRDYSYSCWRRSCHRRSFAHRRATLLLTTRHMQRERVCWRRAGRWRRPWSVGGRRR